MLGRQQIAGIPTAISELFKNAHDAYAEHVEIDFYRSDRLFVLRDDGIGMTREEFESRWLTVGTESKLKSNSMEPPYRPANCKPRVMMGEKGIGRLSVAVIGSQVLVLTRAERKGRLNNLVAAYIHWDIFSCPAINLDQVEIPVKEFKNGLLPTATDIKNMLAEFQDCLNKNLQIPQALMKKIAKDIINFTVDPVGIDTFLDNTSKTLSLKGGGHGTHFIIKPASELLADDIDSSSSEFASPLEKALLGFTNTMTPGHLPPTIETAFRDYKTDTVYEDWIDNARFFTPREFENADHFIIGDFDTHGQFKGTVSVYGEQYQDHVIPWNGGNGLPTYCGPFKIAFAEVQGNARDTTLPMDEHVAMTGKMDRIGGLYVYKDGIRILPYGDVNSDWLKLEYRRSKSAEYYHFSFRRMFGVVQVSSEYNPNLIEKSGREGFQENKAYRQMRDILEKFFVQLAADFFREGGSKAKHFVERKNELERLHWAEEKRKKFVIRKKTDFQKQLEDFFLAHDSGSIEKEALELETLFRDRLFNIQKIEDRDLLAKELLAVEHDGLSKLRGFSSKYKISKPKIGLSKNLLKEWNDYLEAYAGLDEKVFQKVRTTLEGEITNVACSIRETLSRRNRIESSLRDIGDTTRVTLREENRKTTEALSNITEKTKSVIRESQQGVQDELNAIFADFNRLDLEPLTENEIVKNRIAFEQRLENAKTKWEQTLSNLRSQLENVSFDSSADSNLDQLEAVEQRMVALEEQTDMDLQLTQLGMAVEVINHEFTSTIRAVRSNLKQLKAWADVNENLQPLYRGIRSSFDHLDGYLALFTPLHRRLYRNPIEFHGSDISKFLEDLFGERLERHNIKLEPTLNFQNHRFFEYPSSFYPVYVNIVDNAIFWLKSKNCNTLVITLDVDGKELVIRDTGPGILPRDEASIFEFGFTRKPGGRGMGLYISKNVLQKINYDLTLDTPSKGHGASFRISPTNGEKNNV